MKLDETERNLAHSYVDNAYEHHYQGDIESVDENLSLSVAIFKEFLKPENKKSFLFVDDFDKLEDIAQLYKKLKFYNKSIEAFELAGCRHEIGNIYYDNLKDYASAQLYYLSDFKTPSSQFKSQSLFKLGLMHWKGHGIKQDNIEALKWFNISNFTSNSNDMDIYIAGIKKEMTLDEINQSNSLFIVLKEEITKLSTEEIKYIDLWKNIGI